MRVYHLGIVLDDGMVEVTAVTEDEVSARIATHQLANKEYPNHLFVVRTAPPEELVDVLRTAVAAWQAELDAAGIDEAEEERRFQEYLKAVSN